MHDGVDIYYNVWLLATLLSPDAELAYYTRAEVPTTLTLSGTSDSGYYGAMYSYSSCYTNCTL